jgi:filamentous hemagglutinin family protein
MIRYWCLTFIILIHSYAFSLPRSPVIKHGKATLDTQGNTLKIHGDHNLIIDWEAFSIGHQEGVHFLLPSDASKVLNRVISKDPSLIEGLLHSNGHVFLINPNGIIIGKTGVIDVNGFLASTLDLDPQLFLQGDGLHFSGETTASIKQMGVIRAQGANIYLLAPTIENTGTITAPNGKIVIAAAKDVWIHPDEYKKVFISSSSKRSLEEGFSNQGDIQAANVEIYADGNLYSVAINQKGLINADGIKEIDGEIYLVAEKGTIDCTGSCTATQKNRGGTIEINSGTIALQEGSCLDVSHSIQGGNIFVGKKEETLRAPVENVLIDKGALLKGDSLSQGDGGHIHIWSQNHTEFLGQISAMGGPLGGNGGKVEVSGKNTINYQGSSHLLAPNGKSGTLLLDPKFISVVSAGVDPATGQTFASNPTGTVTISGATITAALNLGSVVLQANTDITIDDVVALPATANDLTLQAGRSIVFPGTPAPIGIINLNGGNFFATINDNGAVTDRDAGIAQFTMGPGSQINTNGGNITISHGSNSDGNIGEVLTAGSGANVVRLDSGSGVISITGDGRSNALITDVDGIELVNTFVTSSNAIIMTGTGDRQFNQHLVLMTALI